MRNVIAFLVSGVLLGCGFSSAEVTVGESLTVGVHHSTAGRTSVRLVTPSGTCSAASVSLTRGKGVDAVFASC